MCIIKGGFQQPLVEIMFKFIKTVNVGSTALCSLSEEKQCLGKTRFVIKVNYIKVGLLIKSHNRDVILYILFLHYSHFAKDQKPATTVFRRSESAVCVFSVYQLISKQFQCSFFYFT